MRQGDFVFTSESVSEGHPDKVSDRISDAVVDAFLALDPYARVACETLCTTNRIVIAGEVRLEECGPKAPMLKSGKINAKRGAGADAVKDIGYEQKGFHWKKAKVAVHLHGQSADIAMGVDAKGNKDEGAGDQGIMFGYADERDAGADAGADAVRAQHPAPDGRGAPLRQGEDARADAKSQVTLRYVNGKPVGATAIVVSTQHSAKARPGRRA